MVENINIGGYTAVRRLGAGGSGTVFAATDPAGELVAVKVLHPNIAADPLARERLRREVAVINRINHPGVAQVLDLEVDATTPFIVTELVEGVTLAADVSTNGPWNWDDLTDLAVQLSEVLEAVHAAGVVHRDLKPGNVMLSANGPVLIDFGTAQADCDERLTATGLVTGTPGYVPPEVLAGADPDVGADWWAWAALLVYCATGRPPFGAGAADVVLANVLSGRVDVAGIDPVLAEILGAGLAPDPRLRVAPEVLVGALGSGSVDEVRAELAAQAAGGAAGGAGGGAERTVVFPAVAHGGGELTAPLPSPTLPLPAGLGVGTPGVGLPAAPDGSFPADAFPAGAWPDGAWPGWGVGAEAGAVSPAAVGYVPLRARWRPFLGLAGWWAATGLAVRVPPVAVAVGVACVLVFTVVGAQSARVQEARVRGVSAVRALVSLPVDLLRGVVAVVAAACFAVVAGVVVVALLGGGVAAGVGVAGVPWWDVDVAALVAAVWGEPWLAVACCAAMIGAAYWALGVGVARRGVRLLVAVSMPALWVRVVAGLALVLLGCGAFLSAGVPLG